jgi:mRNA interferase MazF
MKKGDIVVVPFPFTDLSDVKTRPALVVSGKKYNGGRNVLLVAISTKIGLPDFSLEISSDDLEVGALQKKSYFRLQNFFSLEKRLIKKPWGR